MAADQGYAKAQASLGKRYALGEGVDKDLVQALFWMSLAADQGLERAVVARDDMAANMTAEQVADADALLIDSVIPAAGGN